MSKKDVACFNFHPRHLAGGQGDASDISLLVNLLH